MVGVVLQRVGLAGAAGAELTGGVRQLRPEDALVEAMMRGWRGQPGARGLREETIGCRERLVRRFQGFTNEFPWQWGMQGNTGLTWQRRRRMRRTMIHC